MTNRLHICAWIGVCFMLSICGAAQAEGEQPYQGQESRSIKALSNEDIAGLRAGDGMGYAKAAELNGYPGPRHVLDHADDLALTAAQRAAGQNLFETMKAQAIAIGGELLAREADLDRLFADGAASSAAVAQVTADIGDLEAKLRAIHLDAHVRMRAALDERQIAHYNLLRGYATGRAGHGVHGGH